MIFARGLEKRPRGRERERTITRAHERRSYVCQQCGHESPKWLGRCPQCGEWNALEERVTRSVSSTAKPKGPRAEPLSAVPYDATERLAVPLGELHRVLGGGIVPGSLVLLGGDPGIGKSTLLLQMAALMAPALGKVLYVAAEESPQQIKLRANRMGIAGEQLYLLAETSLESILECVPQLAPGLVIVDSIQTIHLEESGLPPGSIQQLRECAWRLMLLAKETGIPIFLVGHVTKEGILAGPKALEHLVDTVLYLEGERFSSYRLLRATKNRFGPTQEVGVFAMTEDGLEEVADPSALFLAERQEGTPGAAVVVTLEGTRPLLAEIQALTSPTAYPVPRRTANGVDANRLLMLVAVLGKRLGLALANQDVYVNVVGGLQIEEPAADLGVALAIASSFRDVPVPGDVVALGEIGLGGELRGCRHLERRLVEAARLGFRRALVGKRALPHGPAKAPLELIPATTLAEALQAIGARRPRPSP